MKTPITARIEAESVSQARHCAREGNRSLANVNETVLRRKAAEYLPAPAAKRTHALPIRPVEVRASHAG